MNPAPVLATLLHLRLWAGDASELPDARAERLQDIAVAIAGASASREEEAFLLALGEAETHFAKYTRHPTVCVSGPRGMRCDSGRAYGYWSLWRSACPGAWELPVDDPRATALTAQCAVALYRMGKYTCKNWAGAFAFYAGRRCSDAIGIPRARRMNQIQIMLEHGGLPWPSEPVVPKG